MDIAYEFSEATTFIYFLYLYVDSLFPYVLQQQNSPSWSSKVRISKLEMLLRTFKVLRKFRLKIFFKFLVHIVFLNLFSKIKCRVKKHNAKRFLWHKVFQKYVEFNKRYLGWLNIHQLTVLCWLSVYDSPGKVLIAS